MVTDPTFIHGSQILENACLKAIKGCLKAVSCCWMTDAAMHRTWRRLLTETRHHLLHHPLHYLKLSNFHTSPGHKYLHFTLLGWGNNKGLWFVCPWSCTMLWFEFFIVNYRMHIRYIVHKMKVWISTERGIYYLKLIKWLKLSMGTRRESFHSNMENYSPTSPALTVQPVHWRYFPNMLRRQIEFWFETVSRLMIGVSLSHVHV